MRLPMLPRPPQQRRGGSLRTVAMGRRLEVLLRGISRRGLVRLGKIEIGVNGGFRRPVLALGAGSARFALGAARRARLARLALGVARARLGVAMPRALFACGMVRAPRALVGAETRGQVEA